jgi:hypothetical protein
MVASSVSSKVLDVQVGHFGCKLRSVPQPAPAFNAPHKVLPTTGDTASVERTWPSSTLRIPDRRAELPRRRPTCEDDFLKPE